MLKDLISTSFKAFRNSHNSMPEGVAVRFERTIAYNMSDSFSYTAPCDGWFRIQARVDYARAPQIIAKWNGTDVFVLPTDSYWAAFLVPMAKGDTIAISGGDSQNAQTTHYCVFIASKGENAA